MFFFGFVFPLVLLAEKCDSELTSHLTLEMSTINLSENERIKVLISQGEFS